MSFWTSVIGMVKVTVPGRTQPECDYVVQTVVNHLPLITGSEGPVSVHIVKKSGHSSLSNTDEYLQFSNLLPDESGTPCRYGWLRVQNSYILVIEGALRDRFFLQTAKETVKFLNRLSRTLEVTYYHVDVFSDDKGKYTFQRKNEVEYDWIWQNYDRPWNRRYDWHMFDEEECRTERWVDHLLWRWVRDEDDNECYAENGEVHGR